MVAAEWAASQADAGPVKRELGSSQQGDEQVGRHRGRGPGDR
jgi:hypothetical protein